MSMANVYEFRGNYYCSGHVTWMLNVVYPFGGYTVHGGTYCFTEALRSGNLAHLAAVLDDYDEGAEADLDAVANRFGIDRDKVGPEEFPVLLPGNPIPPSFCTECLRWFDEDASIYYQKNGGTSV